MEGQTERYRQRQNYIPLPLDKSMFKYISPLHSGNPLKSTFVKTENPDEMQHNTRASDFFQDWWAKVTYGAKMVGHFLK